MEPIRVLVVSDDALSRTGLSSMIAGQDGMTVVGSVGSAEGQDSLPRDMAADVAVFDLGAPSRHGTDRFAELQRSGLPVLALAASAADAREARAAGVSGVLFRDRDARALGAGIRAVAAGLSVLEPEIADAGRRRGAPAASGPVEPLTPRELEVLQLLTEGLSNKAIADRLHISEHTAKFHLNAILGKLGVQSRTEALVQAARLGLVLL